MSLVTASDVLAVSPVIPVVVIQGAHQAVPLARALVAGGIGIMEITLRTEAALECLQRVAAEVPEILVGAGTVTTPKQVDAVVAAGASFVVLPGSPHTLVRAALGSGLPVLPGAATVTEVMALVDEGCDAMKFFPAEASGGRGFLAAVASPLPHVTFCPTGGIGVDTAEAYLSLPNVACVGGSWLTPSSVLEAGAWATVKELARRAALLTRSPSTEATRG